MKSFIAALMAIFSICLIADAENHTIKPHTPSISLFESVAIIKEYMKENAKFDFNDRNLTSIKLHYFDSHPRKGEAWIYSFSHKTPKLGGDMSIFHFTDGEIIEFHHGP